MTSNPPPTALRGDPAWLPGAAPALATVFASRGFAQTRMDDLVAASGVPRATLYYHFRGKEAVLGWLMQETIQGVGTAVAAAADGSGSARDRLTAVVRALVTEMAHRPDACRVLIGNLEQAGRLSHTLVGLVEAFHQPVVSLLAAGAADGSLRSVSDRAAAASAMFGAVTISVLQALVMGEAPAVDALGDSLVDLLIRGLEPGR